jgi:hypothetical protein
LNEKNNKREQLKTRSCIKEAAFDLRALILMHLDRVRVGYIFKEFLFRNRLNMALQ